MNPAIKARHSPVRAAGTHKGAWLAVLEQGSHLLQEMTPLTGFHAYVVGFHPAKDDPDMQMEAHHFCRVVNDDFLQCVLFDGNTKDANLIGIEYIVSQGLFDSLPEEEKDYWHPHNFELLSGTLIAPGLPAVAEKAFLGRLMNSYGKTWHTWHTGRHDGQPGMDLPLGGPKLMWSFNREGECDESLIASRDQAMGVDTREKKGERSEMAVAAHPQRGVDAIADHFSGAVPIPGVVDVRAGGISDG